MTREILADAVVNRIGHLLAVSRNLEFAFFARVADKRGLHQNRWNIGRFQYGESGLFAAPAYLEAHGTPVDVVDLSRHEFASYVNDLIQLDTVRWLDEVVSNPRLSFLSSSMIAQLFAAMSAAGIVMH